MRYRRLRVQGGTYFFTVVTSGRKPVFGNSDAIRVLQRSIAVIRRRHPFAIDAEVILPDHIHTIWSLPEGDSDFSTRWMLIKSAVSRDLGERGESVWQKRFWEHLIRDDEEMAALVSYIHFNPVKHGLVSAPKDWLYSSFHSAVARGELPLNWGNQNNLKFTEEFMRTLE